MKRKSMKKFKAVLLILASIFIMQLCVPVSASAASASETNVLRASVKKGLKKENGKYYYYVNGKKVTNSWRKINKKQYYFTAKGYAATYSAKIDGKLYVFNTAGQLMQPAKSSIVKVGKYSYYVNKNGQAATGWMVLSNKLYFADSKGRFYKSKTYKGVTFSASGAATSNTASKLKIKSMRVVNSITNKSMSKAQKLQACWNYMTSRSRFRYSSIYYPNLSKKGWQKETALKILNENRGNCYGFACGFAALAYEVGYTPYVVCGRVSGSRDDAPDGLTRHCWVKINGLYYDPEAQYKGWMTGVYGDSYYDITHTVQKTVKFA